MTIFLVLIGGCQLYLELCKVITKNDYSLVEMTKLAPQEEFLQEFSVSDMHQGLEMFFSIMGPPSVQPANLVDNEYFKYKIYELRDNVATESELKMIACPE